MAAPETIFLRELATIERAIQHACRRASVDRETAEDFASYAKLRLIENGYGVIAKYEGRSSFGAFIGVVVQRLMLDYRITHWGKWHASTQAKRLGETAMAIELMLHRDGHTLEEALPALQRRWPRLTEGSAAELAGQLPPRTRRPRRVNVELADFASDAPPASEKALTSERAELSRTIASIVRASTLELDDEDRVILRLRFEADLSVAEISRTLGIDQKPLYRRIRRALLFLRQNLEAAGVSAADAEEIVECRTTDLDFGFATPHAVDGGSEEDLA